MSNLESDIENKPKRVPTDLITENLVQEALCEDVGSEAKLLKWEVMNFTDVGDNYACVVSSVQVDYSLNDEKCHKSYVAKLNPCREGNAMETFSARIFLKESNFYKEIIPALNNELNQIDVDELKLPRYICSSLVEKHEVIFLEDLRDFGFKMFDRKKGLDPVHISLVLTEMAKLHASSKILFSKMEESTFIERYPFLFDVFSPDEDNPEASEQIKMMMKGYMENGALLAETIGGYESIAEWTKQFAPKCLEIFTETLMTEKQFRVICHGDCWNNNILFKYDEEGKPVDIKLLDLQLCRDSSLGTDLNYLMYTSLNGNDRKPNLEKFLNLYYVEFSSIISKAGLPTIFTEQELREEYHNKNLFGFIMCLIVLPLVIAEANEAPDFSDITDDNLQEAVEQQGRKAVESLETNPLLRPRILDMFDEMIEYKAIELD